MAFVYVPINLATSIFGMNLQQLNQSGQNTWLFVTTALICLLVTAFFWLATEVYNSVVDYKSKGITYYTSDGHIKSKLTIAVRVAVYFGLIDEEQWHAVQ